MSATAHTRDVAAPHQSNDEPFAAIVGSSQAMQSARARARRLATCPRVPILILGETGVGKEVFAHAIHKASHASDAPFVAINCGALSRELLASELFGYADGAFTGARRGGHAGKLAAADGGTLFLDEFGELPLELQPPLLRALESGEYQRVGESRTRKARFRLLTATNSDLETKARDGQFRRDLYYRAAVTKLTLPPLRARGSDVVQLFEHLQRAAQKDYELPPKALASDVAGTLCAYHWPGNVRELRNVVIAASLSADGPHIRAHDIQPQLQPSSDSPSPGAATQDLRTLERRAIRAAMTEQDWNLSRAARALGLAKSTLHSKLKRHGIERAALASESSRA